MFEHIELKGILLGDISDVKLVNNLILVQSKVQGKDIHIFDRGGNYIRSIIRYGRANNEVLNLQSFCYNKYKNTIDVLCNYGTEIKQYTIDKNLSPITISLPKESIIAAKDIEIVDDSTYVLYKDISYLDSLEFKLYLFNYQEKSIIGKFIPLNKEIEEKISFSQNNNLYTHDGKIFFYEVFQNGIFEIANKKIHPIIAFTENSYTLPPETFVRCKNTIELIQYCKESNYIWAHINCIQWNKLIFSFFTYNQKIYGNVIDLINHKSRSYLYVRDDLFSNSTYPINKFNIIGSDDNKLICNYRIASEGNSYLLFLQDRNS